MHEARICIPQDGDIADYVARNINAKIFDPVIVNVLWKIKEECALEIYGTPFPHVMLVFPNSGD